MVTTVQTKKPNLNYVSDFDKSIAYARAIYGYRSGLLGYQRLWLERIAVAEVLMDMHLAEDVLVCAVLGSAFVNDNVSEPVLRAFLKRLKCNENTVVQTVQALTRTSFNVYSPTDLIVNISRGNMSSYYALYVWLAELFVKLEHVDRYGGTILLKSDAANIESKLRIVEQAVGDMTALGLVDMVHTRLDRVSPVPF